MPCSFACNNDVAAAASSAAIGTAEVPVSSAAIGAADIFPQKAAHVL